MRSVKVLLLLFAGSAIVGLAACTRVTSTTDSAATLNPLYTAQAQTLQAIVTEAAQTSSPVATAQPSPVILPTVTFATTPTIALPTPTSMLPTPTTGYTSYCNAAAFILDVTVPDGTTYTSGTSFTKTWRLKNVGTCTWTSSYTLVFSSGDAMQGPASQALPGTVYPGYTVDISVNLVAPYASGHYRGNWVLRSSSGTIFGVGSQASTPFYVDINVSGSYGTVYDFATEFCSAQWSSAAGNLPCPGTDGSHNGFVLKLDNPRLEDGTVDPHPGLLTAPQNTTNGYIEGQYPAIAIQNGDRFQSIVNCQYNTAGCDVIFQIDYQIGDGPIRSLWRFHERYEGKYFRADLDLSDLAGQNVKFMLSVDAYGSPNNDRALWAQPRIVRLSDQITRTRTPTPTVTGTIPTPSRTATPTATGTGPVPCNWISYVTDVTVPDGTVFAPNTPFIKTWRLKNIGTCSWTTAYALVYASGDKMGGMDSMNLPVTVASGQMIDLSLDLTSPAAPGHYRGYWLLRDGGGLLFGIGASANEPIWVDINVVVPTDTSTPTATHTATPTATPTTPAP
jgi:hypothetical protein